MAGQPQRGKQNNHKRSTRSSQSTPSVSRRSKGKFSPKNSPQSPPSVTPNKVTNEGEDPELGNSEGTKEEELKNEEKDATQVKPSNETEKLEPLPAVADLNSQQDTTPNLKQKTTLEEHTCSYELQSFLGYLLILMCATLMYLRIPIDVQSQFCLESFPFLPICY